MSSFSTFDISASGVFAQRTRMDAIANNIANAESTRTPEGGPYRRQAVSFRAVYQDTLGNPTPGGVKVDSITQDPSDFRLVHDPSHPDADANGYVKMPNVNVVEEMVDMISATRAYEANITAMNATKSMIGAALDMGKA
jgi:flagellar basal-body rod protein FlgC